MGSGSDTTTISDINNVCNTISIHQRRVNLTHWAFKLEILQAEIVLDFFNMHLTLMFSPGYSSEAVKPSYNHEPIEGKTSLQPRRLRDTPAA